ncbi:hypothetical protein [Bifidobacterium longum]|uniref:hypothetical protein n=1 Tax=Bifidobacterium longum TaxID=216816 RepID=UPI00189CD78E|nr:hypothetical protein [Bifidobacterium longum]MDB6790028.1 hypothetical protein [Bifidobacterium longum]
MWGSNPRAEVWANLAGIRGDYTNGTVSCCGYDKESAAVDLALKDNPLMQTLMMWPKLNVNTGYSGQVTRVVNKLDYGYELCFGGMGMSEFLDFMRGNGFAVEEMHGDMFDGYTFRRDMPESFVKTV